MRKKLPNNRTKLRAKYSIASMITLGAIAAIVVGLIWQSNVLVAEKQDTRSDASTGRNAGLPTVVDQYLVRGNKLWSRNNRSGWSSWSDVTSNIASVGSGDVISFSSVSLEKGYGQNTFYISQSLVKGDKVWIRNNYDNSWSQWKDVTDHITPIGSGKITAFTHFLGSENGQFYTDEYLTRGGKIWYSSYRNPSTLGWKDVTSNVASVGTGEITSFSTVKLPEGFIEQHLTRGGKIWSRNNRSGWSKWTDVTSNVNSVGSGPIQTFLQSKIN